MSLLHDASSTHSATHTPASLTANSPLRQLCAGIKRCTTDPCFLTSVKASLQVYPRAKKHMVSIAKSILYINRRKSEAAIRYGISPALWYSQLIETYVTILLRCTFQSADKKLSHRIIKTASIINLLSSTIPVLWSCFLSERFCRFSLAKSYR